MVFDLVTLVLLSLTRFWSTASANDGLPSLGKEMFGYERHPLVERMSNSHDHLTKRGALEAFFAPTSTIDYH